IEAYTAYAEFFYRFDGVDLGEKKPLDLLMCWGITLKGILLTSMISPLPLKDDEALIDLMVDISLKIWGYQKKS
ncbi:MAG TPA: hypothetical protein VN455_02310, partial [Methanotrichaceae archaeon]|nr:hypothetical protein [Methanotrichaceae archaeon]